MTAREFVERMPGIAGSLLLVVLAAAAALAGAQSLFYEAWGQPAGRMVLFLAPAAALVAGGLVVFRWPFPGAGLLVCAGVGAGGWWAVRQSARGMTPATDAWMTAAVLVAPLLLAAGLLALDASHVRSTRGRARSGSWLVRHWRSALLVAAPLLAASIVASQQLPAVAARHDDGARGARVLGTGLDRLIWAPRGPGWNRPQADGELPSWTDLVHHQRSSLDRCAFLNDDGTALVAQAGRVWRLPTVSEIVGALSRGGEPAGCVWDGVSQHAAWPRAPATAGRPCSCWRWWWVWFGVWQHAGCRRAPEKATPVWAPDDAPIYYWSRQEASAGTAFAVNYTGGLSQLPKAVTGLNVGYRCVRRPGPGSTDAGAAGVMR